MIHLAQFSGGVDSLGVLLWLKEQGVEFRACFEDTGWEHPITYAYVEEVNQTLLGGELITLRSEKYEGFADLVIKRHRVPGLRTRFCTQELKVFPVHRYIESLNDEVTVYQGVRADESLARAKAGRSQWVEDAGGYRIERPLFDWTKAQVFDFVKGHGLKPNPLYLMGAGRVGCWPCVFVSLRELKAFLRSTPEIKDRLRNLESRLSEDKGNNTFFRYGYIPERFCSRPYETKDGRMLMVPTCDDVFRYLESVDENQLPLIEAPKCMSIYNLCE